MNPPTPEEIRASRERIDRATYAAAEALEARGIGTCQSCVWWVRIAHLKHMGYCHGVAPIPENGGRPFMGYPAFGQWPATRRDQFCGLHKREAPHA